MVYIGLAFSTSMLPIGRVEMVKEDLVVGQVRRAIERGAVSCFNPSHQASIDALRGKYGIEIQIPENPPRINLWPGDSIIVLQVRGLPRLSDARREYLGSPGEYTPEEIEAASFSFMQIGINEQS